MMHECKPARIIALYVICKNGIRFICGSTLFTWNPDIAGVTGESFRPSGLAIILFLAIAATLAVSGCTSSPTGGNDNQTRDAYLNAYTAGIWEHAVGQDFFNNGTAAWEASDYRTAIARYASASLNYSRAAKDYEIMGKYARNAQEKEFSNSLRGCVFNLSKASDDFVNAAVALGTNDTDTAYQWYTKGQTCVDTSEALLNRSIANTPQWLMDLASG